MPGSLSRSSPPSAPPPPQVREVIIDSVADYRATERAEWVLKWPGACLIAVSGIFWTAEVEEALTAKGNAGERRDAARPAPPPHLPHSPPTPPSHPPSPPLGAAEYFQKSHEQLMELTRIVSGKVTRRRHRHHRCHHTHRHIHLLFLLHRHIHLTPIPLPRCRSPRCRRNLSAR